MNKNNFSEIYRKPVLKMDNNDFRALLKVNQDKKEPQVEECESKSNEEVRKVKAARAERHKKKKESYIKMKQLHENSLSELSKKYRDRAEERRNRSNSDLNLSDPLIISSGYHAVAPDIKSTANAQEIRHKLIQESKYLGGDLEHTHLVKGLDYVLLQKVREEIKLKEESKESSDNDLFQDSGKSKEKNKVVCKSHFASQIYKSAFPPKDIKVNPLFAPGRMTYAMNLSDDADTDIPTVIIRSNSDVANNSTTTMNNVNEMVINKLTQILSYLRQEPKNVKKSKKKNEKSTDRVFEESYLCSSKKISTKTEESKNYKENIPVTRETKTKGTSDGPEKSKTPGKHDLLHRLTAAPTGYAECYPGQQEMNDAIDDSEDEIDYSKMDLGNQKGFVGRWDFDTQEEYSAYLNNKEALPKAAFQYGLKMNDGRRTRKYSKKNEKAEINQEWNTIKSMIIKRKENSASESQFLLPHKLSRKS